MKRIFTTLDIFFIVALAVVFWSGLQLFLNFDAKVWVDVLTDDAYYYLGIARNIVEHDSSSFLPPFITNGYQPLWLMVITLNSFIFGTAADSLVIQNYVLNYVFIFIFVLLSRKYYGLGFPAVITALAFPHIICGGMEVVLIPGFFILFMTASAWQKRGVWATLLFLSRLDALAVVVARDLYFYIKRRNADFRHYYLIIPVICGYALLNFKLFGVMVPVSGLAKAVGNSFAENFYTISLGYIKTLKTPFAIFLVILAALRLNKKSLADLRFIDELSILFIAYCCSMLYYGAKSGWGVWYWYYWPAFLMIFYLTLELALLIQEQLRTKLKIRQFSSLMMLLAGVAYTLHLALPFCKSRFELLINPAQAEQLTDSYGRKNLELVEWIANNHIPAQSFFAMGDRAGSFGFFLGNNFRFLHAEGLVGPTAYYQAMSTDAATEFVDALKIDYWIADREQFLETKTVMGVIEPVQGLSAHHGPYLICFDKAGIVLDQSYSNPHGAVEQIEQRYVFDGHFRTACPTELTETFKLLRAQYSGVKRFSLPYEYD